MRLIWSTQDIENIRKFSGLLRQAHIEYSLDDTTNTDWNHESYGDKTVHLWIQNEDDVAQANVLFQEFIQDPKNPRYNIEHAPQKSHVQIAIHSPSKQFLEKKLKSTIRDNTIFNQLPHVSTMTTRKRYICIISKSIVFVCSLLLLLGFWYDNAQEKQIPAAFRQMLITSSPTQKALFYDYPTSYKILDQIVSDVGYEGLLRPKTLPEKDQVLYQQYLEKAPWLGIYPKLVAYLQNTIRHTRPQPVEQQETPFENIRKGEVWRAITPIFLHANFLHLFFNMIWLMILGTQIEERIGAYRYCGLIILIAVVSNTLQYIVSGPAFLGFSGVICGMAFFIRARQKRASWESYQMASATFHFILFFIGILAGLSTFTFLLESFRNSSFPIQVANTAHLAGAAMGWILGHLKFFAQLDKNQ